MKLNKRMVASFALVAILLVVMTAPSWAQAASTRFNRLIVSQTLTSVGTTTLTGAVTTGGDVTVGDDATITGDATAANVTASTTMTASDFVANDDLIALDDLNITDDAVVNGSVTIGGILSTAYDTQTVVNGQPITPTATYMDLQATGTVTASSVVLGAQGTQLILINSSNSTVIIPDSGGMTGAISLAQYDSLFLISDGARWVQLTTSNN